jgi:hypothetical protein
MWSLGGPRAGAQFFPTATPRPKLRCAVFGAGADVFHYSSAADAAPTAEGYAHTDYIVDFSEAEGTKSIYLRSMPT